MDVNYFNVNRGIFSPLIEHNGCVIGVWMEGNNYRNKSRLYGAYPPSYLKRMRLLFHDDFKRGRVLHLFSGSIRPEPGETTFDINPDMHPDIVGDAECVNGYFVDPPLFSVIFADPPYDHNYVKYGTEPVNKKKVVKSCADILKPGGFLVWLDTIIPIWSKADGWRLRGTISIIQSTNHKVRVASILGRI